MKNYVFRFAFILFFCIFFGVACAEKPVVQIGSFSITKTMAEKRQQVAKIYYPEEKSEVGLGQLVRAYTFAQILKNNGKTISDEELDQEIKRIDSHSRAPEMLAQIKAIFGTDTESYKKIFILPNTVDRMIYPFFQNSEILQKQEKQKADQFLQTVLKNSKQFEELAKKDKLPTTQVTVMKDGLVWDHLKGKSTSVVNQAAQTELQKAVSKQLENEMRAQSESEAKVWMTQIIPNLKPGQVHPELLDKNEVWVVLKYFGNHKFKTVAFQKANFEEWLAKEKEKVQVVGSF